ncbi:MAG: DUF72 domain-containing protein [Candidatus Eremiobacteraeota bacterium]|nr:DUF72 domain-containing protein [Candidatus Eremiobacteraeota bacterium]
MIYVGTCGYSYKDWIGPFYPGKIKPAEMLGHYAQRFAAVEIDASYYGVLAERTIAAMASRTPKQFRFCFKAPQTVTHAPDPNAAVHPDARAFQGSLQPMRKAGKLGAVLLQFPNGFKPTERTHTYLERLVETFDDLPLVAEFRNREWQNPATLTFLQRLGVGWCNVDMPQLDTLMHPSSDATSRVGYVRMHGRNAAQWWTGTNVTRYQYTYELEELEPWTDRIAEIDAATDETYAFFNNHARGGAAQNAEALEALLELRYGSHASAALAQPAVRLPDQPGLPGLSQA